MARREGWLDEVLEDARAREYQREPDDPNDQYVRCLVLKPTPEQSLRDRTDVRFDTRTQKKVAPVTREAHMALIRVLFRGDGPAWEVNPQGVAYAPGLILVYGSGPPTLDGQWMYRHMASLTSSYSAEVRTEDIVTRDNLPHPERHRW